MQLGLLMYQLLVDLCDGKSWIADAKVGIRLEVRESFPRSVRLAGPGSYPGLIGDRFRKYLCVPSPVEISGHLSQYVCPDFSCSSCITQGHGLETDVVHVPWNAAAELGNKVVSLGSKQRRSGVSSDVQSMSDVILNFLSR
jgi:hypothetical protein